ncbi:MAG TPA: hypothetical protein VNM66_02295, partial [Thermodesulfobacteriota bacterium]|nr:hypothetical protein [Thermodesulfobacteriota bacterium]
MRPEAVREELDRTVAAAVRPVAAGLAAAYAALSVARFGMPDHPGHAVHFPVGAGSAVALLGVVGLLRRRPPPAGRGHAVGAGLAALVLANATVDLVVESPDETTLFVLLVVGAGAVFLSWRWFAAVLVAAWACWLPVALVRGASNPREWAEFGAYLLTATGLAVLVQRERLRAATRLAVRSVELGEALGRLRAVFEASPLAIVA